MQTVDGYYTYQRKIEQMEVVQKQNESGTFERIIVRDRNSEIYYVDIFSGDNSTVKWRKIPFLCNKNIKEG